VGVANRRRRRHGGKERGGGRRLERVAAHVHLVLKAQRQQQTRPLRLARPTRPPSSLVLAQLLRIQAQAVISVESVRTMLVFGEGCEITCLA
jgi:hypothetical protein